MRMLPLDVTVPRTDALFQGADGDAVPHSLV